MSKEQSEFITILLEINKGLSKEIEVYQDLIGYMHSNVGDNDDWPLEVKGDSDESIGEFVDKANRCFQLMGLTKEAE